MLTALLGTSTLRASSESPSCDKVLKACDEAVNDLVLTIDAKDLVIKDLTVSNALLASEYADAKAQANAWYHNPFVLGALGLAIGVLGGVYVSR